MLKKFLRKLVLGEKADSESFIQYLRKQGVKVGENVCFYSPKNTLVDVSCPCLLTIGDNVCITHGVIILTHDYSWSVIKQLADCPGVILGAQSPVRIGSNVFIGMNAVITRGVTIGDNVVIGAGSVVTKDCEPNGVYAGNPARKLMTIEQYREKRTEKQVAEARELVLAYRDRFGTNPPQEVLSEYFMLFCTADDASENPVFRRQMETGGNYPEAFAYMQGKTPAFDSYEDFLGKCLPDM